MGRYFLRKLLLVVPTLLGATVIVFFALRVLPGDPVRAMLGEEATADAIDRLRRELGLDEPLIAQYWSYLAGILHGDLGNSLRLHDTVLHAFLEVFPATLELAVASFFVSCVIGVI